MVLMSGANLVERFEVTADDVCYLSMPLFHSNAVVAGWAVAVATGAAMAPAKFSASRFLADIRRYGATYMNYVGKPLAYVLATPERAGRRRQPAARRVRQRGQRPRHRRVRPPVRRAGVDGFGSTENAVIITREAGTPTGSIGKGFPGVAIYNPDTVTECPRRRLRRGRRAGQRRRGGRRAGQHLGRRFLHRLLQRRGGDRRTDAARHVLVGRPGLPRRRRLDLPGRPHRRLDARRRREPRGGPDRTHPPAAARHQPGRRVCRARRERRRPGDGRRRAARGGDA